MRRIYRLCAVLLTAVLFFQSGSLQINAASDAAFYVQTAAPSEDGTIEVTVYLDGARHLGGADVELLYDTQKVTFVSSSLGSSFSGGYSDINYDAQKGEIHYVMLYPNGLDADGILMNVTFQLKGKESYQPELKVNDLIDNSMEMNDISYTISYQQADGTWSEQQDTSGVMADENIPQETLEEFGSEEDIENGGAADRVTLDSDNNITKEETADGSMTDGNTADGNMTDENETADKDVTDTDPADGSTTDGNVTDENAASEENTVTDATEESIAAADNSKKPGAEKNRQRTGIYLAIAAVVIIMIGAAVLVKLNLKKKDTDGDTEEKEQKGEDI